MPELNKIVEPPEDLTDWHAKIDHWKREVPLRYDETFDGILQQLPVEVGQRVTSQAIQLMGYEGTYHHRMVEKLFRDVKVYDIFEGTAEIQQLVVARHVLDG